VLRGTALLCLFLAFPVLAQAPRAVRPEPFPLESVSPGLEGTGWTVLSGREPVAFKARVEGVAPRDAASGPMIICSLSGSGLEESGVLAAMSGSPVYVEGRLLGAVAYTWSFARRAQCGLTPAAQLLSLLDGQPQGAGAPAPGSGPVTLSDLLASRSSSVTPVAAARVGAFGALEAAGFAWGAAGSGGRAMPPPSAPPGPGEGLAAQLVAGDLEFAAFGTVAAVDGARFVAFGHPFMRLGPVDLPVASARVDALIPSLERGMKLCSSLEEVGALRLDANSGVAGTYGARAATLPVTLHMSGEPGVDRVFHVRLARHRFLTPALLQGVLGQAQTALEGVADPKTVTLRFSAGLEGGERLTLSPLQFSGPTPFQVLNDFAGNVLDLLLNNPYEPVGIESLDLELVSRPGLSGGGLVSLEPDRARAVVGEAFSVRAGFQPLTGPARTWTVALPTSSWPEGGVVLWAGDAFSLFRKLTGTEAVQPAGRREILDFLRRIPSNDRLYVAVLVPSEGRTVANRRLDAPPPSLAGLLGPTAVPAGSAPPAFRLLSVETGPETGPFEGVVELTVPVRPARR